MYAVEFAVSEHWSGDSPKSVLLTVTDCTSECLSVHNLCSHEKFKKPATRVEFQHSEKRSKTHKRLKSVSYTHLTLPTRRTV